MMRNVGLQQESDTSQILVGSQQYKVATIDFIHLELVSDMWEFIGGVCGNNDDNTETR